MHIKLVESLSKNIQSYLATYFVKNNISQSFNVEIHRDNESWLDLVFAEGPLDGKVISFSNGKFLYERSDLAVISEESWQVDEKSTRFLLEDGFVLCAEALLRKDYTVFDPLTKAMHRSRWYLQNKFIPMMTDCVSNRYLPPLALESGTGWWEYIERDYDMHLNLGQGFYCNKLQMKEGYVIYFYNFPEPSAVGEALYGAVIVNKRTSIAQYYKLEMSFDDWWFISWRTLTKERTMGVTKSRNRSDFLSWILNRI